MNSVQRRRFFRQRVALDIRWALASDDEPLRRMAKSLDLSGNGLSMCGQGGPAPVAGDRVVLELCLPGSTPMYLLGQVTRELSRNHEDEWCVAVTFKSIDEAESDAIVAYVMAQQARSIRQTRDSVLK